jgi:predicted ester cyclase
VAFGRTFAQAFADAQVEPVRAFSEGDLLCPQVRFRGTHTGPLRTPDGDRPPTGRTVEFPYCIVARFDHSLVVELDEYLDQLAMLQQLGVA